MSRHSSISNVNMHWKRHVNGCSEHYLKIIRVKVMLQCVAYKGSCVHMNCLTADKREDGYRKPVPHL